jgi:hypothetical protein
MPSPWNPTQGSEFRLIVALDSEVNTEEVLPGSPQWKHDLERSPIRLHIPSSPTWLIQARWVAMG